MRLLTISLYRACCVLLILHIWLCVIVQAELLFQPLKTDSQITCLISQLLYTPINAHELDEMSINMGTIFSNTLEAVAPIKLKKVREKRAAPWYKQLYPFCQEKLVILSTNEEKLIWTFLELRGKTVCPFARTEHIRKLKTTKGFYLPQWLD